MINYRYNTIAEMFLVITEQYAQETAYLYKEKGMWKNSSFGEVNQTVQLMSGGLRQMGLKKHDHIAIMAPNSRWWAMTDYASACSGTVLTTIYPTLTAKQANWIIQHSESKVVFCGDKKQGQKVLSIIEDLHKVEKVVTFDNSTFDHPKFLTLDDFINNGKTRIKNYPDEFKDIANSIKKDDLLTLIYTSGTTGEPKGVMLTHFNLCANIEGTLDFISISKDDTLLSFLPLSHTFERMAGHLLPFSVGAKIAYAESILKVSENMLDIKPTLMVSVPRLYEKIYSKIMDKVSKSSFAKRAIFNWAIKQGKKSNLRKLKGKKPGPVLKNNLKLAQKLVFSALQEKFGGKIRFFVSGGAPLSKEINEFFNAAGLVILEGYGLTETSPVVTVNLLEKNKLGTIGKALPNVEVKIEKDGEIIMSGPNRMVGYYKDEVATKECIEENGWFHTGDIGVMDEDGYITITDRKKNIIVTAGGKNVAPAPMENVLVSSKWVDQILIIGDRQKYLAALVVPAFPNLEEWAEEKGIVWKEKKELLKNAEVKKLYDKIIFESMEGFAQFEKVKKYILLPQEFSIESGELTPSLKVKRSVVVTRYKKLIDDLYNNLDIEY